MGGIWLYYIPSTGDEVDEFDEADEADDGMINR